MEAQYAQMMAKKSEGTPAQDNDGWEISNDDPAAGVNWGVVDAFDAMDTDGTPPPPPPNYPPLSSADEALEKSGFGSIDDTVFKSNLGALTAAEIVVYDTARED